MKVFPSKLVREIDQYTIENEPIKSIDLMERAATKLVDWYVRHFKINQKVLIFAGPGNNGGDALALARMLHQRHYKMEVYLVSSSGKLSTDSKINYERLLEEKPDSIKDIRKDEDFPKINAEDVVIDGIFGSGLSRVAEGIYKQVIQCMNASSAKVISVDIPSGLFGEDNTTNDRDTIVQADYTLTFQFPFLSFLFYENEEFTGQWIVQNISLSKEKIEKTEAEYSLIDRRFVSALIPAREKFAHKGSFGHALSIAGSYGMMGAAVLCGEAILRSGAGLATAHIPALGYDIMQSSVPEVIASIDESKHCFSKVPDLKKYSAIAVGPGLGTNSASHFGLKDLMKELKVPLVIDADALNLIAMDKDLEKLIPRGAILTPHPGEFDRIAGKSDSGWSRHLKQIEYSKKHKVVIVLKGANTGISLPDGRYFFNSSGNPGMATGGSGDVLTGIIVSLLAQGFKPEDAAIAGVFLHGYAGDLAAEHLGQEALIAGDIINNLGEAFKQVKANPHLNEDRIGGVVQ